MNLKTFGKKAELTELHQQALDRLQKIASMVPGVIYQYQLRPDGSSCFPYASEAILEIYRVSPDEVREDASKVFANLHPDDLDGVAASIQASAKDLTPWQHEYRVKFSDGTIRSLYGNALPQREADGSVIWHGFITDVTDRLNAEKAAREADRLLRDNNSRMDLAMQVANMAWWEMDVATGNVTFDKRKTDMLGYSPEKFTHYKDFTDLVHPADHDRAMDAMRKHFMGAVDKYEAEYRILTRSGKYKWFYDIGSVVSWDSGGLPLYVRGLVLDITDRKQMEEELKLASVRLELAARAGGIGVWDYDIVNNILFWDNQMFELYGIEKKDFTDGYDTWKTLIHPDDLERSLQEGKNAVRGDKEYDIEFRAIWPDGSVHHIRANAVVQRNEADHSIHMIGTNWDVTELRQAEKAKLDDSENRYLSIFQGTPDGIIIADPETKMIIFANPAQCQMLGYTEEELKMMNIAAIHPEETYQQFKAEFNKQIHGEKTLPHDIQCLKKNGEIFYADISSSILDMNGRQYIVGFFRDITERREAEVAIKEALVKAESGNRLKTAFMQNISHEVRTPLNGILGFGNLLIESDLTDSEKQQYVSLLQASIDRLENTITDYLDISLIFSDNMNVSRKSVNVMQAFMSQKNKFQNLCDEKKLAFNLIIPPQNESFCIQTDPELFLKIISHFLSNAIKFTREGSITLGFSVGSGNVEFFCTDTGVGIEKEAQECIFESFVQENLANTRGHEGSGLGLSIVRGLTNLLGGEIRLESIKGQGSSFFLSLPVAWGAPGKDETAKARNRYSASGGLEILIVEDDFLNLTYIETILRKTVSVIYKAVNGLEAVELCRKHPGISMVLMDIKMPVMNGFEAVREIRKFNNNVVIIAQTAYAHAGVREEVFSAGCNDYITKPIKKTVLLALIDTYFKMQ